jgi:Domain of unknown function (DUF4394)
MESRSLSHWTCLIAFAVGAAVAAGPAKAKDDCGDREDAFKTRNLKIVGLTVDQRLVRFKECDPSRPREIGPISGLTGDSMLVGIDYRVQDGLLYGVGNAGGIYTIDPGTAAATKARQLTVALNGTWFGVDFNPAANALRIVSDTGQNLRQPFADPPAPTAVDTALNYTAGVPTTGITGAAYVNNDLAADTGTTLFDIDTVMNQVVIQVPPNAGTLVRTGSLTVDPDTPVGFDIYSKLRDGATVANKGLASLVVGGVIGFYRIDMLSGKATLIDTIHDSVIDIAIPLDQGDD